MEFAAELITALIAGVGGAYGLLHYLGKTLVRHQIDKSLKSFDAHLARKTEALKTELSIYAHEQNVTVSRVDAQRAKAIQDVYAALRAWSAPASVIAVGSPLRNVDEETELGFYLAQAEQAHQAGKQLANTLADNAIYFDIDLYALLADLSSNCMNSVAEFLSPLRQGAAEGVPAEQLLHYVMGCREVFAHNHQDKIQPAMQELTDNFRKALGIIRGSKA